MFCCKTTTTTTAASPAGRQSKMTVAVISQFSVFGFRFWVLGFWILRLGWKSESIKVTKWLNFGVRQSALNVRCLPVACCMLHVAHWLLTAWTFVANWQKKWKVSQHLRARSCKHSSCVMLPHNVAVSACVCVCVGALWIDDRVEICSHVTFKFVGKSSAREIEEKPEETPAAAAAAAACHSCCHGSISAFHAFLSKQELHDFLVIFRQAALRCPSPAAAAAVSPTI